MTDKLKRRISELEDEVKAKDRRIEELRQEIDELRDLNRRMEEHADDYVSTLQTWQSLDMQRDENGEWEWQPFWDDFHKLVDKYLSLVRRWNRHMGQSDTNPPGRPLAADAYQIEKVRQLHEQGESLRAIAGETELSLRTVRTIVGRWNGNDRTTEKYRKRLQIEIDRKQETHWKQIKRTGDALPRRVQAVVEEGQALVKEAKGLGKGV
jgi:hypothetical protein